MVSATGTGTAQFDPRSREYLLDPQAAVQHLYEETPVAFCEPFNAYVVLRYEDVKQALDDFETYASGAYKGLPVPPRLRSRIPAEWERVGQVVQGGQVHNMDPPSHTVQRRALQRTFTIKRVESAKPDIEAIANEMIDAF